eukprot:4094697-Pyramimonas_sp.AAC.2
MGGDAHSEAKDLALLKGQVLSRRGRSSRGSARGGDLEDAEPLSASVAPAPAELKPGHVKCMLCLHHDDDWDPVDLEVRKEKVYMMWGKPAKDGVTQGVYCFYCVKIFCAKFRQVGSYTIAKYAADLGKSEKRMKMHMAMVDETVKSIIQKGGSRRVHLNWEDIEANPAGFGRNGANGFELT